MAKEFIVYSSTKAKFILQVANGTVDKTQIGFIGDTGEVWINGAYNPIAPYPTTVATAPVRTILSDGTSSHTLNLSPNVVYEHTNGSFFTHLAINLLNPSNSYAQTWTLRLSPGGSLQAIAFPSITIKWVNGAPPTGTGSAAIGNVLEIVIRQFMTFYIGEWKIYK